MTTSYTTLHLSRSQNKILTAEMLADQVTAMLGDDGFVSREVAADDPLEADPFLEDSATPRPFGVMVFAPSDRWNSILLSEPAHAETLATRLSRLNKSTALVARGVYNTTWGYELFESGQLTDGFDAEKFQASLRHTEAATPIDVPPEMLDNAVRIPSQKATEEDSQRLMEFLIANPAAGRVVVAATMSAALGIPLENALAILPIDSDETALTPERLAALRTLLLDDSDTESLQSVLDDGSTSETTLGNFLPLLGIDGSYAHLDYAVLVSDYENEYESVMPEGLSAVRHTVYKRRSR